MFVFLCVRGCNAAEVKTQTCLYSLKPSACCRCLLERCRVSAHALPLVRFALTLTALPASR